MYLNKKCIEINSVMFNLKMRFQGRIYLFRWDSKQKDKLYKKCFLNCRNKCLILNLNVLSWLQCLSTPSRNSKYIHQSSNILPKMC